jgi:hypothetical protein
MIRLPASLGLEETTYSALQEDTSVASLRIDDHPQEYGWRTRAADGSLLEARTFVIPLSPVVVPPLLSLPQSVRGVDLLTDIGRAEAVALARHYDLPGPRSRDCTNGLT